MLLKNIVGLLFLHQVLRVLDSTITPSSRRVARMLHLPSSARMAVGFQWPGAASHCMAHWRMSKDCPEVIA
jgi:hypothetical protein